MKKSSDATTSFLEELNLKSGSKKDPIKESQYTVVKRNGTLKTLKIQSILYFLER